MWLIKHALTINTIKFLSAVMDCPHFGKQVAGIVHGKIQTYFGSQVPKSKSDTPPTLVECGHGGGQTAQEGSGDRFSK